MPFGFIEITPYCAPYYVHFRGKKGDTSSIGFQFYYSTNGGSSWTLIGTAAGNPAICSYYGKSYFISGASLSVKTIRTDTAADVNFDLSLTSTCPGNNATYCQYDYGQVFSNLEISMTAYIDTGFPLNC